MACLPLEKLQSLCLRLKSTVTRRRYRDSELKRRSIKISDPYDFQHIMKGSPDNMNEDEKESVRDTDLLIRRRMNILLRKTAATRMIAIEDQPTRPVSASTNRSFFNTNGSTTTFGPLSSATGSNVNININTTNARPKTPMKTRAGYRGLASSSAANGGRGLAYATALTTETRPSITQSFATLDDANGGAMSPGTSLATSSEGSASPSRHEGRGQSI
ncbi:unnamed protein product [Discula destructiva]